MTDRQERTSNMSDWSTRDAEVAARRLAGTLPGEPMAGRLGVFLELYMPDNRVRDVDNPLKATLDALAHSGLYADDRTIDDLRVCRCGLVRGGRVDVTLWRLKND